MSEATIPIKELMEKTEQWLLGQGYKKSTLGFYRATWNRFLSYAADNLPVRNNAPTRHLVIPAVIRLLYCCGFRIGEVLRLRVKDVDLDTGIITVHNGKDLLTKVK